MTNTSLLNAADVPQSQPGALPSSGSDQDWLSSLWCTPGTRTYTLLGNGRLTPPPLTYRNIHGALNSTITKVQGIIKEEGDGPVLASAIDRSSGINGVWYTQPGGYNFMIHVRRCPQNSNYLFLGTIFMMSRSWLRRGYHQTRPMTRLLAKAENANFEEQNRKSES